MGKVQLGIGEISPCINIVTVNCRIASRVVFLPSVFNVIYQIFDQRR